VGADPTTGLAGFLWQWSRLAHGCCHQAWLAAGATVTDLVAAVEAWPFAVVWQRDASAGGGGLQLAGQSRTSFGEPVQFTLTTSEVVAGGGNNQTPAPAPTSPSPRGSRCGRRWH
jgi:hypothetical protein